MKAYKTELKPTQEQIQKLNQTLGNCRFAYNLFIQENKRIYAEGGKFVGEYDFSKWLNNDFRTEHPECSWLQTTSSKATRKALASAETAYKNFFKKTGGFPRFKKRGGDIKAYFPRNNATDLLVERHRIKIPTLGWVRLKEFGYIPTGNAATSCTVSEKAGRYYVSVLCPSEEVEVVQPQGPGLGIDLGIKVLAFYSDESTSPNINKTQRLKKLNKRLKRAQQSLSRKYESRKKSEKQNNTEGRATWHNIQKQKLKVQKLYKRIDSTKTDYQSKEALAVAKREPSYVTLEDLNIRGMLKNRCLAKAIKDQSLYTFKQKIIRKCRENGIEVREVGRFYPSSKLCSDCGHKKEDLRLSDRVYKCDNCGLVIDRDLNASINLRQATEYKIVA